MTRVRHVVVGVLSAGALSAALLVCATPGGAANQSVSIVDFRTSRRGRR